MSSILEIFRLLTGASTVPSSTDAPVPARPGCQAARIMAELNPRALMAMENGCFVAIEDTWDCPEDGRIYRMEYRCTPDGAGAVAFCRSNPWDRAHPHAGALASVGHVFTDGFLCLGSDQARSPEQSRRCLRDTVLRARYWCAGFSVLKETGCFPNL